MNQTENFSPREKEVVKSLLEGKSNKQIALALGISTRTVEFHLNNLFEKMGVSSRVELILKLGKSTGDLFNNQVKSAVDSENQILDNGNQRSTDSSENDVRYKEESDNKKEFAMKTRYLPYLAPIVIILSLALIVGGILTQKYAAVVVGISCAGAAAYYWINHSKKQEPG